MTDQRISLPFHRVVYFFLSEHTFRECSFLHFHYAPHWAWPGRSHRRSLLDLLGDFLGDRLGAFCVLFSPLAAPGFAFLRPLLACLGFFSGCWTLRSVLSSIHRCVTRLIVGGLFVAIVLTFFLLFLLPSLATDCIISRLRTIWSHLCHSPTVWLCDRVIPSSPCLAILDRNATNLTQLHTSIPGT
jgi:hypothetical protein